MVDWHELRLVCGLTVLSDIIIVNLLMQVCNKYEYYDDYIRVITPPVIPQP